jgi:hypothetical protein
VAKLEQPSRDVMRACAGLHADQAPRNIGQSLHELRTGHPRAHDDLAAPILANQMKGDFGIVGSFKLDAPQPVSADDRALSAAGPSH